MEFLSSLLGAAQCYFTIVIVFLVFCSLLLLYPKLSEFAYYCKFNISLSSSQGHGEYTELYDEKEFFETTKKSENVVCHFYRDQFVRCKLVDKHLNILARKHIETKFCKINAEKAPFLTGKVLPKSL